MVAAERHPRIAHMFDTVCIVRTELGSEEWGNSAPPHDSRTTP